MSVIANKDLAKCPECNIEFNLQDEQYKDANIFNMQCPLCGAELEIELEALTHYIVYARTRDVEIGGN